jgi:ribosomal protein L37AE/L43A
MQKSVKSQKKLEIIKEQAKDIRCILGMCIWSLKKYQCHRFIQMKMNLKKIDCLEYAEMKEINPIEFAELYSAVEDPVSIADQLGVSFEELVKTRKRLGFPPWKMEKKPSTGNRVKIDCIDPAEFRKLYYEMNNKALANHYNISQTSIYKFIKEIDLPHLSCDLVQCMKLYNANVPYAEMAKILGISIHEVHYIKKKLKLECELREIKLCPSCTSTRIYKQKDTQKFRCEKCKNIFQNAVIKKVSVINYDYPRILLPDIK